MRVLSREGYALQTIDAAGLQGRGFRGKIQGLAAVPRSLWQSRGILRSFQPDVVIGVGGYASGPVVLAAWFLGVKTAIHEQNAFPGLSNRILGRVVDRIFISFADSGRHFPPSRTVLTGNPVRRRIRQAPPGPQSGGESPQRTSPFTLFVFGGSQGAHRLNEAMVEALEQLGDPQGGWRIIHQTGEKDFPRVKAAYAERGLTAEVEPFIDDMDRAYRAADLVICRAGATTIFELLATGKPAILVPYPFAANDHQTMNARTLVAAGAAQMIADAELNGERLAGIVRQLSGDSARLREMGKKAAALAKPEAARQIVNLCYAMVKNE